MRPRDARATAAKMAALVILLLCQRATLASPAPPAPSAIASEPLVALLDGPRFNETIRSEAPVAGGDVLGVKIRTTPNDSLGADPLFVREPKGGVAQICLEISSVDGSYVAANTYQMPAAPPGTYVRIPIDAPEPRGTGHQERFRSARAESFAIVARTNPCGQPGTDLLPVAWGSIPSTQAALTLSIAVQSGRTDPSLIIDNDSQHAQSCEPLTAGRLTEFDALCTITLPPTATTSLQLQLQRCAFSDCSKAPPVRVRL